MGLIFTGVLKQTHTYLLLESDLCYKMFSNLYRIYTTVDPGECFASDRVRNSYPNSLAEFHDFFGKNHEIIIRVIPGILKFLIYRLFHEKSQKA